MRKSRFKVPTSADSESPGPRRRERIRPGSFTAIAAIIAALLSGTPANMQTTAPESATANQGKPAVQARQRARELGLKIGVLPIGELNAITDVSGVTVGQ